MRGEPGEAAADSREGPQAPAPVRVPLSLGPSPSKLALRAQPVQSSQGVQPPLLPLWTNSLVDAAGLWAAATWGPPRRRVNQKPGAGTFAPRHLDVLGPTLGIHK